MLLSAEKIIVLDDGKIAGVGTHQQLLKDCNVYREIAYSQLSEDELKSYQIDVDREKAEIESKENPSLLAT